MVLTFKIKKQLDEYVIITKLDNIRIESKCYYTDNLQDARITMQSMINQEYRKISITRI